MPIDSGNPAAASADLNTALDALAASIRPAAPAAAPEQQEFLPFFHS